MNNKFTVNSLCLSALASVFLTGFIGTNPEAEVADFIRETQATMKPNANLDLGALPQVEPYEPKTYDVQAESPFALKAFVTDNTIETDDDSVTAHCQSPECGDGPPAVHAPYFLESYDLTQLSMVGTILDDNQQTVALIQTPDAGIVNAARGEYLGKNYGMIITIEEDHVVVREKYKVPLGWQNRMAILELFN